MIEVGSVPPSGILTCQYRSGGNKIYMAFAVRREEKLGKPISEWDNIYVVSQSHGEHEIVYGSLIHTMDEAVRPIFQLHRLTFDVMKSLPDKTREQLKDGEMSGATLLFEPPEEYQRGLTYRQEALYKDALLASSIHVRTLLEDFDGRGNVSVPIYDFDGNSAGSVPLSKVVHTLAHYRYCMVSGEFVHDVFSREGLIGDPAFRGCKIRTDELFEAIIDFVTRIRVRDFVGVLRGRLEQLSVDSPVGDVIFAMQNVHSLSQILRDRLATESSRGYEVFVGDLFNKLASAPDFRFPTMNIGGKDAPYMAVLFGIPRFRIKGTLAERKLVLQITANNEQQDLEYDWHVFFNRLVELHRDEPLVSRDILTKRFAYMDQLLR